MPDPTSRPSLLDRLVHRLLVARGYASDTLDTSVGPVHVLSRAGAGRLPPVLLVHGFGAAAYQWAPLMDALGPHVERTIAIDLPGHGLSVRRPELTLEVLRDGVIEALDQVDAPPAVIVGNSLGGAVAVRYVQARPARVCAAHLLSPGGAPMTEGELELVRQVFRVSTHQEARALLDRLHARPLGWKGHLFAPAVRRTFRDQALHGMLARVTDADWLTPEELGSLPHPVRVLWGRHERILPSRSLLFWRERLPAGAEVDEPEVFGHMPHLDSARRTADDIVAFAQRALAQRQPPPGPTAGL